MAATYIENQLKDCGYAVTIQPFKAGKWSQNVIAVRQGQDPSKEIIVGAHYDSVAWGTGADDNASGVAAMMALAARLAPGTPTPRYTVKFVAFGAEESKAMYGSRAFVSQYVSGGQDISAGKNNGVPIAVMVNLDVLAAGDRAYVHGDNTTDAGRALIAWTKGVVGTTYGLEYDGRPGYTAEELVNTDIHETQLWIDSDYYNFYRAGVPFLYMEAVNWTIGAKDGFTEVAPIGGVIYGQKGTIYHSSYDTIAYIDSIPRYGNGNREGKRFDDRMVLFGGLLDRIVYDLP